MTASEILFGGSESQLDGGCSATVLGPGIHVHGDTIEDLRQYAREVAGCYFDETMEWPNPIRLHFVRDEVPVV